MNVRKLTKLQFVNAESTCRDEKAIEMEGGNEFKDDGGGAQTD